MPRTRTMRSALPLAAAVVVVVLGGGAVGVTAMRARAEAGAGRWYPAGSAVPSPPGPARSGTGQGITMSAVGDVILGAAPDYLPPDGGRDLFADVAGSLHADLQMANLEQPLTDDTGVGKCSTAALGKTCFQFRAPPGYASVLASAGFGLVNLANNHAYDFGPAGHQNTCKALAAAGVRYTGPPAMITVVTVKGIRVAVLGFAPYPWANDLLNLAAARDLVRAAKKQADLVVVQVHMGAEGPSYTHVKPGAEMFLGENRGDPIAFSHAVIDAGADLVIGHSPHVLRAMEFYKGHLIAYSLGNFVGYHALAYTGVVGVTAILRVTLRRDGSYVAGTLVLTHMVAPGVPRMDPARQAVTMVSSLSRADFPITGAHLAADGAVTPPT